MSGRRNGDLDFSAEARFGSGLEQMGRNAKVKLALTQRVRFKYKQEGTQKRTSGFLKAESLSK